jgi:hypothetical protein
MIAPIDGWSAVSPGKEFPVSLNLAELEKRYADMSEEEFVRLRREDLTHKARPCYDREIRRRGLPLPQVAQPDPADLLRRRRIRQVSVIAIGILIGSPPIVAMVHFKIYGPGVTSIFGMILLVAIAPFRGDRLVLWLRRFHIRHPRGLRFDRLLRVACAGFGFPLTVQDSTFRRSHSIAISMSTLFNPLILMVSASVAVAFYDVLGRPNKSIPLVLLLFFVLYLPLSLLAYLRLACIYLNPANARKKSLRLIHKIQNLICWHGGGMYIVKCWDSFWRETIELFLNSTSVAVVDVTEISDNVIWELETALRLIGPESIVVAYGVAEGAAQEIPLPLRDQLSNRLGSEWLARAQPFFYPLDRKQLGKSVWGTQGDLTRELQARLASGIAHTQYRLAVEEAAA